MIDLLRADNAKPKVERFVTGHDLIALGVKPGPIFKIILQELLDLQLEGSTTNKDEALKQAVQILTRLESVNQHDEPPHASGDRGE